MKTQFKNAYKMMLVFLIISCSEDDSLHMEPVEIAPVQVQFGADTFYSEDTPEYDVIILFDKPAVDAGTITVKVTSDAPLFFNTIPAAVNNEIFIPVVKGAESAKFKFNPRNDWFIDGHKLIVFELKSVSPTFVIGSKNDLVIDLYDDELRGKPKSYEIVAGENKTKKTYEYLQDGKLAKVKLETEFSQVSNVTTYTYNYDFQGKLHKIQNSSGVTEFFTWENGKIVQLDHMEDGVIIHSKNYLYDNEGNIESVNIKERNSNNTYDITTVETFEYFNGNIKKREVWVAENMMTWNLVSTQTYDTYSESGNPFQMNEILPSIISQPHLPLSFRIEENGKSVLVNYGYEFDSSGRPIKRTATGEVTTYAYY